MLTYFPGGKTSAYIPIGWGAGLLGLGITWLLYGHDVGTDPDVFIGWENETKMPFFIMNYFALWTGLVLSAVVIFNASTPQTRKEDVVEDLQVQGQGLAITNFLFVMVWVFAYPAYIKFPGKEMRDFYPVFTLFNAWMGLIIFIFLGLSSKRFRLVHPKERLDCNYIYTAVRRIFSIRYILLGRFVLAKWWKQVRKGKTEAKHEEAEAGKVEPLQLPPETDHSQSSPQVPTSQANCNVYSMICALRPRGRSLSAPPPPRPPWRRARPVRILRLPLVIHLRSLPQQRRLHQMTTWASLRSCLKKMTTRMMEWTKLHSTELHLTPYKTVFVISCWN